MKKSILTLIFCLMFILGSADASTLKWDASTGGPDGYIVYYTDGVTTWNKQTTDEEMNLDELNLTPGTYTFYVTAFNTMGESDPSETLNHTVDSYIPENNVKPVTLTIPNTVGPVTIIIN